MKEIPKFHKTGLFDPVKHIPLSGDESLWVSFGGRVRFRSETWSDFSFSEANDDTFLLTRVFLHSDLHWGDLLRVFVEGKTAHSIGRDLPGGRRTLDVDNVELQQAFLDIRIPLGGKNVITLRPGRREMLKGKQRLISPLPWGNTLRHWDGVSGILELAEWNIENFLDPVCPGAKIWFQ